MILRYSYIEITNKIFKLYSGKKFEAIPDIDMWPRKAFRILKEYANGTVSDYILQSKMFCFTGSQVGINEQTGIIGMPETNCERD